MTASPTRTLDQETIHAAARAFVRVHSAGMMDRLKDELAVVAREHREPTDARWHARISAPLMGMELAKLIGQPQEDCERAILATLAMDWPTAAVECLIDFSSRTMRVPENRRGTK